MFQEMRGSKEDRKGKKGWAGGRLGRRKVGQEEGLGGNVPEKMDQEES